jgi:predicted amidohydrolase
MNMKIAIAQTDAKVGNLKANLERHLDAIERAVQKNAQVILFPELSLTGYTLRDLAWEVALRPGDALLRPLIRASKSVSIVLGFVESAENHAIYNSALVLEGGEVLHVHRKIYPPTYGMFEEGRYFSRGESIRAFTSKHGKFGVLICEDAWHLSLPYLLVQDGAEVLLCLTASPTRIAGKARELHTASVNHEHQRVYARLLSSYVAFSNRVGFEDGVNFWGGSMLVQPSGEMSVTAKFFAEDLIVGHATSRDIRRARRFSRHLLDEDLDLVQHTLRRISQQRS